MKNQISSNFYYNVKHYCYIKNLELGQLEKELGVCAGYLSRLAKGERSIGLDAAIRTSEYLGVPLKDLCKNISPSHQKLDVLYRKIDALMKDVREIENEEAKNGNHNKSECTDLSDVQSNDA